MSKVTKEKIDAAITRDVPPELIGEQYELLAELKLLLSDQLELSEELAKKIDVETDIAEKQELESEFLKAAEQIKVTMYGYNKFSRTILKQVEKDLVLKRPSKRRGKTFPTEITYKVTDMLECYWKRELPINPLDNHQYGVNDYFTHIAETVEMTFDNVKKIEQKYRPKHSSPEK